MSIGAIWDLAILNPLINILVVLSDYLFSSFGLTIIVLTVAVRAAMYPLMLKQIRVSKAMQTLQVQVAEIRKKYARDRQRAAQEQIKLYKESGVSPAGCLLPMFLQLPIWIALYQSIIRVLAVTPEDFLSLSRHLYSSWPAVFSLVPLESRFFWLDLAVPDKWMLLPILVGISMWVQQKMMTITTTDPKQQAQSQMMLWMMPMMFTFFSLSFPSGLALYWVISNVISIVTQYFITGWGGLISSPAGGKIAVDRKGISPSQPKLGEGETKVTANIAEPSTVQKEELEDGRESGSKRQDRGRSRSARPGAARHEPRDGGSHRRKGR